MLKVFSPGRTELAGNHTDHQKGRVLIAAVDLGITAEVEPNGLDSVLIESDGFEPFEIKLNQMDVRADEFGSSKALVRGVLASFKDYGLETGGFNAHISSDLPVGSGLSSSAAFSVLIGKVLNVLFNGSFVDPIVIARSAHRSENEYFGKPSGLMSQFACVFGKCMYIDFAKNEYVVVNPDFSGMGLTLCLANTGGSHAGLDSSYARIPRDMAYIANMFDAAVLSDVDPKDFYSKGWSRDDRPVRRAMHFFEENERVPKMRDALLEKNADEYIRLMNESGRSSEQLLNNIVTSATGDTKLAEGLSLSRSLLEGKGAWRVHGGGFAGCVQALMPSAMFPHYKEEMEKQFGKDSCYEINIR